LIVWARFLLSLSLTGVLSVLLLIGIANLVGLFALGLFWKHGILIAFLAASVVTSLTVGVGGTLLAVVRARHRSASDREKAKTATGFNP
jgi:hypothetical protein